MERWLSKNDLEDLRKSISNSYDNYTNYIDNAKQYDAAIRSNNKCINDIDFLDNVISIMSSTLNQLKANKLINKIEKMEYCKGNIRIKLKNGNYKYKKIF